MHDSELADIDIVLRSQLGDFAEWHMHDRSIRSPMNFTLDVAERHLNSSFTVFWVENAIPEMFSLSGFSQPIVVFNPRLTELWGDIRYILTTTVYDGPLKAALIERLCLQLMAERSLWRHQDPEFAASAILRASSIHPGLIHFRNTLQSMEYEPITPVYMACWFFALAHELGHFVQPTTSVYSDADILRSVENSLARFSSLSEQLRADAFSRAAADERDFILAIGSVREEGVADVFATGVMLESTYKIMQEIGSKEHQFNLLPFISEMFISLNVIVALNRCERICALASVSTGAHQLAVEALLQPVLVTVRGMLVRHYLQVAGLNFVFGESWSKENVEIISSAIDSANEGLKDDIDAMEKGMAAAIQFALNRVQRPDFFQSLDNWNQTERNQLILAEFLDLARQRNLRSPHFDALAAKIEDPDAPLNVAVDATAYWCPCIIGPNDYNQPFSLPTRHGNVIFVFASENDLCQRYCELSCEDLPAGHHVDPVLVLANSVTQLHSGIARRLPVGFEIQLAIEGTERFAQYMGELAKGTIWPD